MVSRLGLRFSEGWQRYRDEQFSNGGWAAVIVQVECQGESFAMGLDRLTGKTLWKLERPNEANWASPVTVQLPGGKEAVVLQCSESLMLVDPNSGDKIWELDLGCQSIPSCTYVGSNLLVPGGKGMTVLDLGDGAGEPKSLWTNNKVNPGSGSALARDGVVYALNGSVLVTADCSAVKKVGNCVCLTQGNCGLPQ